MQMNEELQFKDILKSFLQENGISQTQFACKIGVRQSQVSEWLKGKAKPGYDNLKAMVIAFQMPAEYFLGLDVD